MNEKDFEGTLVLERLAEIEKVDDFLEAVDSDDFEKVETLMRQAGVDKKTIRMVLERMVESE